MSEKEDSSDKSKLSAAYRKEFVKHFVNLFETKLSSYESELQNKSEKLGTTSKASKIIGAGVGGALGASIGVVGVTLGGTLGGLIGATKTGSEVGGTVVGWVGNYLGKEIHKTKAGKVIEIIPPSRDDPRKILVESALTVFCIYEYQFTKISWTGGWRMGMHRLAQEAADRLFNYITELHEDLEFSVGFFTRGIMHGKPKEYIKNIILKNKVQFNSIECKVSSIFTKVGINVPREDSVYKYYRKNNEENKTKKYGYRLLFDWELNNFEKIICDYVQEDCQVDVFNYTLLSETEKLEEVDALLDDIDKIDPLLLSDRIQSEIKKAQEENKDGFEVVRLKCDQIASDLEKVHSQTRFIEKTLEISKSGKNTQVWFDVLSPVKSFTGRIIELENLHGALQTEGRRMVISQAATISGLGGVGKSELARKYAEQYSNHYDNVVWVNSETQESLKESFEKLAKELRIPIYERVDDYFQERNIIFIVKDVYIRFKDSVSLFIFDNAEEYNDIRLFLPTALSPTYKKPYLLITSRNCDWEMGQDGDIKILRLQNFSTEEAENFMKTALQINTNEHDAEIKELTEILHCFPLALHQAQAYVVEKNKELELKCGVTFGIRDYINEYKKEMERLKFLNFSQKHGSDRYVKTVFTTWMITFDNFKNKVKNGQAAILMVELLAYFASDRIPVEKIFLKMFDQETLWSGIELLWKYSIISLSNGLANIHRLVQEIIRLQLINKDKEIKVLRHALELINRTVYITKDDITHFVSVWKHSVKYDNLVNESYSSFFYGKGKSRLLHLLAESGETETIKTILTKLKLRNSYKFHQILNAVDQYGRTPLYMAVENDHYESVVLLNSEGAKTDNPSSIAYDSSSTRKASGWTPLHVAAYNGFLDIVIYLVKAGSATEVVDTLQRTPIDLAVNAGHSAIVEVLNPECYEHLLQAAIRHGDLDDVKRIYSKGVDLNKKIANWTSLHVAAFSGHLDIAEFLVDNGAIVDDPSDDGSTPLHGATRHGHLHLLKYLISKINYEISSISNYDGWKLLHVAAQHGHLDLVKYLIEDMNQDINMTDKKGTTPLHIAAFMGQLEIVKYLISKDVNISATDILGTNTLLYAAISYQVEVINFILANSCATFKAPITNNKLCDVLNLSVFHAMAAYDALDIVRDLVEKYNFDVNIGDKDSFTPLHAAVLFNSTNVINYLLQKGANANAKVNIRNVLSSFRKVLKDDRVTNCSMKTIASPLETFFKDFYLADFASFLLTPSNMHRGLKYRPNHALYQFSNFKYAFIIKIFSNCKSMRAKINYAKSYMDERRSKNPYFSIDSDYFITLLGKEEEERRVQRLKLFIGFIIFMFIIILYLSIRFMRKG